MTSRARATHKLCPLSEMLDSEGTAAEPKRAEDVDSLILDVGGIRVILDIDLARMYGVRTKALKQAVRRNRRRFPADFMVEIAPGDADVAGRLTSRPRRASHGGIRYPVFAFTEQGVAMLSSVLRSDYAIAVNIEIMRAFVKLRRLHGEHAHLVKRLDELEKRYDESFRVVFDAIRALMSPPTKDRQIRFRPKS